MSNPITVYLINTNGVYLHEATANPLQDGTYNVQWNGVLAAPPTAETGQVPVWNAAGQAWTLVSDNRSSTLYRTDTADQYALGSAVMINSAPEVYNGLGAIPGWLTTEVPPAPGSTWTNGAWVAPTGSGTSDASSSGS